MLTFKAPHSLCVHVEYSDINLKTNPDKYIYICTYENLKLLQIQSRKMENDATSAYNTKVSADKT